jgi:hypothetical protein
MEVFLGLGLFMHIYMENKVGSIVPQGSVPLIRGGNFPPTRVGPF